MREANDEAVDCGGGECAGGASKRRPFARVGRVPGVFADHDAQRQRHLGRDLGYELERGSQSAVTDGAHQFETVRTATRGFARICQALDDDFKKGRMCAAGRESTRKFDCEDSA